jgi:hypothetical protein
MISQPAGKSSNGLSLNWDEMAIHVDCHADGMMSHLLFHVDQRFALLNEKCGEGIPQIERKPLTLRTRIKRLARETICFSKSAFMHDAVIGLFVNRYEFGTPI